ncbi:MAG: hypothetical protein B6D39_08000 [Anaerolineae bacterium UTCFX2]|nr:hypothetical protein [Anaerolineales bacterium]OQY90476.1 MAG: hypothetical protein B6D39_08000 [Anaerolineae bacterium UTCFX2]
MSNAYTELVELDPARKWEYLQRYYAAASRFYDVKDEVIDEAEVTRVIAHLKPKPAPRYRNEIPLTRWRYRLDENDEGVRLGYFGFGCDDSAWEQVETPHMTRHIPEPVKFGQSIHDIFGSGEGGTIWKGEYAAWYRCEAPVGDDLAERVAYLAFDSVNLESTVWVNENPVMLDHLGLFPFEMEVTEELRAAPTGRAQITLQAKTTATNKPWMFAQGFASAYYNPPFSSGKLGEDWEDHAWAGLAGAGWLRVLNRAHLRSAFFQTRSLGEGEAEVACRVTVRNEGWERYRGKLQVEVSRWLPEEGAVERVIEQEVEVLPMNEGEVELVFRLEQPAVWEPGKAALYLGHVVLVDEAGQPVDDVYETFGVRTVEMKGGHFYVNGRLTYLRGTHELTYYPGESPACPSDAWIVREVLLHQTLGANCSRFPSDERVHYARIAEICDQLGYMLVWAGYFAVWIIHTELELHANRDVPALVRDLRNHPSIIVWEMGDEPLMEIHNYRRYRWYEQVYRLVEKEDNTRPIQPAGHLAAEIWDMMRSAVNEAERKQTRARILRDFPLYSFPLLYWDFHTSPMILPLRTVREAVEEAAQAFDGARLSTYAEFGFDALPAPERQIHLHGRYRWGANPYWNRNRKEDDLVWYGREITPTDWRETQAAQALVDSTIIACLRELPGIFGGFFLMMMVDVQTFLQGLVDAGAVPKLAFFVLQQTLRPVFVTGLSGNTVVQKGDPLRIMVSNHDRAVSEATLRIEFRDGAGDVVGRANLNGLEIPGGDQYTCLAEWSTNDLPEGLLALELSIFDENGTELCRNLEMFYLESQKEGPNAG